MWFQLIEGCIGGHKNGNGFVTLQHGTNVGLLQHSTHNGHIRTLAYDIHDIFGQRLEYTTQRMDECLLGKLIVPLDGHTVGGITIWLESQSRWQLVAIDANHLARQLSLQQFLVGHILQLHLAQHRVQFVDRRGSIRALRLGILHVLCD